MKKLNLKPTHKPIRDYYEALEQYNQLDITHEGAVSSPFSQLLATCAKKVGCHAGAATHYGAVPKEIASSLTEQ